MNDQQREAMQMALEALQYGMAVIQRQLSTKTKIEYSLDKSDEAITALRSALAQPQGEWVDLTDAEIALAVGSPLDEVYLADFRAVIAKFKEKNTPPVVPQGEDDLTIAYMVGYEKGKDYMKEKAAKMCEKVGYSKKLGNDPFALECAAAIRSMK